MSPVTPGQKALALAVELLVDEAADWAASPEAEKTEAVAMEITEEVQGLEKGSLSAKLPRLGWADWMAMSEHSALCSLADYWWQEIITRFSIDDLRQYEAARDPKSAALWTQPPICRNPPPGTGRSSEAP